MNTNFTVFDNTKILLRLSRSENWKKDITIKALLGFNIISVLSFIGILISDIVIFYGFDAKEAINIFTWQLLVKILLVFSIFMFNKFQVNRILSKKLMSCTNQDFSYCNCEGYYLVNRFINNQKLSRSYRLNKIFNLLLTISYLFVAIIPFIFRQQVFNDLERSATIFSIIYLVKLFLVDLICAYVINSNIFGKKNKFKVDAELGNFINYLYLFIYFIFYGSLWLFISYLTAFNILNGFSLISLYYAAVFTIPFFYVAKVINTLVLLRKDLSKTKYLLAFMPLFVLPEKSINE
ncbi:hypothetical protein HGG64_00745 [Mycoplasma phocoeninasale]|uniref:Uncharacterized protein n=1 Tax=Mycoplasma phocoeninasale TaxID=2726117 RepID=A0A858U4T6_9MOLU|nr:hypothetical protein [Mycoplasma phocoeninasale]QJG66243.1 hypothetical protein HGG64_00745 [Mycoplasma phocoeninasale]